MGVYMKYLLSILLLFSISTGLHGQQFSIDKTRFIGCNTNLCGAIVCESSCVTTDNGILFVGFTPTFSGSGDIPSSPADTSAESFPGNAIIGLLDSNLQVQWIKVYGGSWFDGAWAATQTVDGNFLIAAYTTSNNRDVSGNHQSQTGDIWILKLSNSGSIIWQKCYGSVYDEHPISISLTKDNGFIVLGSSNGKGDDVPEHYSNSQFDNDWFVFKADSIGTLQWTKTIGGTGDEYTHGNIITAPSGYYLLSSSSSEDYDCNDNSWHTGQNTSGDYYIFKLDTAGNILWDSSYGGDQNEILYSAIWDSTRGSMVLTGGTTSYDNAYMVQGNSGDQDMWTVKIDTNGIYQWGKCFGGAHLDCGTSLVLSKDGYVCYGNTFSGNIGAQDNLLVCVDSNGNEECTSIFGGTNYDIPNSLLSFSDSYVATGTTNSDSFTVGIDAGTSNGSVENAFFTRLYFHPLSVQSNNVIKPLLIYPSPCTNTVTITREDNDGGTIRITNIFGQTIYLTQRNGNFQIDVSDWPTGTYFVSYQDRQENIQTRKFIKI
jgi:hypothetical protein